MGQSLPDALTEKALSPDLLDAAKELGEVGIDTFLTTDTLKDIPILSTIIGVTKGVLDVRDRIFFTKVARFLFKAGGVSAEDQKKFREKLDKDPKLKKKVAETLVLIIEKLDDLEKPDLLGELFCAVLEDHIDVTDFRRLAAAIEIAFIDDLRVLTGATVEQDAYFGKHLERLVHAGLSKLRIGDTWNETGKVSFELSPLGVTFMSVFQRAQEKARLPKPLVEFKQYTA